jgi:type I restriction enzyme S subunit
MSDNKTFSHPLDFDACNVIPLIKDFSPLSSALYQQVFSSMHGQSVALHNIVDIIKGKQINCTELFESGDYYVMNGGIVPSGYYNDFNTPAKTISISEGGNSCGYVQFNDVPFWSGGHCYTLQLTSNQIDLSYLFHSLKYREQDIMALRIGSGLPNIQKKDLERFQILMPTLDEQQRYAKFFDSLRHKEDIEVSILNQWQRQKLYLLGQMFI